MIQINNDWDQVLTGEADKEYYKKLRGILAHEYKTQIVYPDMYNIFNALKLTPYSDVKVVILGQDPYHGAGQAHGLSFSVQKGTKVPPSLQNIYKEIQQDLNISPANHGELTDWAHQGVLLLNTVLTVRASSPNSHKDIGWQIFTDNIVKKLNEREKPMVFLLWGANAKKKIELITNPSHLILTSPHPSPFSAYSGFFGCHHFSQTNAFLTQHNMSPINWEIT